MAVNITELRALVTQCESERLEFKKSTGDVEGRYRRCSCVE